MNADVNAIARRGEDWARREACSVTPSALGVRRRVRDAARALACPAWPLGVRSFLECGAVSRSLSRSLLALATTGCNGKVTRAECTERCSISTRHGVAGESTEGESGLSPDKRRSAREMKKALRKRAQLRACAVPLRSRDFAPREYLCAMNAPTPETVAEHASLDRYPSDSRRPHS